ncbi:hypothetical protein B0H13DRAFT_2357984 [Mycena leptocephala]|nr:hypothetical protein B0H13DRAFT_2357984 [Mycena leptocephala]
MRRSLKRDQTLTETHDNAAAWAGIGSALIQLWNQKAVPAALIGVSSTFLYLASVLILHLTTPALFSLETFNASRPIFVETHGLPSYNWSDMPEIDFRVNLMYFLPQPLSLVPTVKYQVVFQMNDGAGNATVNATAFNITCGYLADVILTPLKNGTAWNVTWPGYAPDYVTIPPTQNGVIASINATSFGTVYFYTTIPVLDSSADRGLTYNVAPPLYNATSSIQIIGLLTLEPEFQKTTSTWSPYTESQDTLGNSESTLENMTGNVFVKLWGSWYQLIPTSDFPLVPFGDQKFSFADLQLNQMLNLVSITDRPQNVTLHALENALSTIVASMFWTLGNIPPVQGYMIAGGTEEGDITTMADTIPDGYAENPNLSWFFQRPFLLAGNTTVTAMSLETRLNLSIIAVGTGLAVSIVLLLLTLPSSLAHRGNGTDIPIEGTGMLHSMWLYRNHPELETLLQKVDHPTDKNLRVAGMVRATLVDGRSRESFRMTRRLSSRTDERERG